MQNKFGEVVMHEALERYLLNISEQVGRGNLDPEVFILMEITVRHCDELYVQGLEPLDVYANQAFKKGNLSGTQLDKLESRAANGCLAAILQTLG